jgi:aspartate-semialdehyde dehydrogenase
MLKVAVVGATGNTGSSIINSLLNDSESFVSIEPITLFLDQTNMYYSPSRP